MIKIKIGGIPSRQGVRAVGGLGGKIRYRIRYVADASATPNRRQPAEGDPLPGKLRHTGTFEVLLEKSQKDPAHAPARAGAKRHKIMWG